MAEDDISGRYRVPPGNPEAEFADAAQLVLANKCGINELEALQVAEEESLARAYEQLLGEVRTDTPLTCDLIRHIHHTIFGDLFEWAGRWRTVQISKPDAIWPPPQFLEQAMQEFERTVLTKYSAPALSTAEALCSAIGEIQGEFLSIHPFREGNARAIKLLTDLLAAQCGQPLLLFDSSKSGQQQYIDAARAALLKKDYQPLTEIALEALERSRSRRSR